MKFTLISEDTICSSKTVVEFTAADVNVVLVKMKEFLLGSGYQWIKGDLEFVENTDFSLGDSGDSYFSNEDFNIHLDDIKLDISEDTMATYSVAGAMDDGGVYFADGDRTIRV